MLNTLFLIPAREGSKGLPKKNTKTLGQKSLVSYSIDFALNNATDKDIICISTNDNDVIRIAKEKHGLEVPFVRSEELSNDSASLFDVIIDALNFYKNKGVSFKKLMLLQPTSPFRIKSDFEAINKIYDVTQADLVVSVKKAKESPYFTLFEEDKNGNLKKIIPNSIYVTRQDCPPTYVYNGSMYLVNIERFLELKNFSFENIRKYEMPDSRSIDIDTQLDWVLAEYYKDTYYENC